MFVGMVVLDAVKTGLGIVLGLLVAKSLGVFK